MVTCRLCSRTPPSDRFGRRRPFASEFCERTSTAWWASISSGPLSEIVDFRAIPASFRFVRSAESDHSTPRSVFDLRIAPKTSAKLPFGRFSRSIDFEPRADDFLDDSVDLSRCPEHPSTFDCRSRPLSGKSSFFYEIAHFRQSFPLPKAICRCREALSFAKSRNRFLALFSSLTSSRKSRTILHSVAYTGNSHCLFCVSVSALLGFSSVFFGLSRSLNCLLAPLQARIAYR